MLPDFGRRVVVGSSMLDRPCLGYETPVIPHRTSAASDTLAATGTGTGGIVQPEGFDDALGASYRLLDRLGEGATGEVWRAVHRRTDEVVATKLLRREHLTDRDLVGRFVQERSVLTGLRHPSVVAVRDLVVEGDRLAIVMEHVEGGSLREVLAARGTLPPALAVDVVTAVLDGLAAAHERDVVHRDVKPDNVLLALDWESARPGAVKLVDFGIARIITERRRSTTGLLGTPEYMSPELLTRGTADAAADVYGVGILLYELLAGRTPFAGPGNEYTIAHRHVTATPPPLEVPGPLAARLDALLEKDPARRPGAAAAAAALRALRPGLDGVPALPPHPGPEEFDTARGPATVVRGLATPSPVAPDPTDTPEHDSGTDEVPPGADLGTPGQRTVVRPVLRRVAAGEEPPAPSAPARRAPVPGWRDPKLVAVVAVALVLLGAAVLFVTLRGDAGAEDPVEEPTAPAATGPVQASLADPALPTGLRVERAATYDAEQGVVDLALSYTAERAPLSGPIFEVLATPDGSCPTSVAWQGRRQEPNLPTSTGIDVPCSWSLEVGTIEPGATTTLEASFELPLEVDGAGSAETALAAWLGEVGRTTSEALEDPDLATVDSYPVQRLRGITVDVPSSTVTPRVVPIRLYPQWPGGVDELNPIWSSTASGGATEVLAAVAGGTDGITFSSGCSSALGTNGLAVTALSFYPGCTIRVEVGNLETESPAFDIVSRGG